MAHWSGPPRCSTAPAALITTDLYRRSAIATIEKRTTDAGETSYGVKVRLRGYPSASATFERLTDAKRWAPEAEAAIRDGRYF